MDVGAPALGLEQDDFKPIHPAIWETLSAALGGVQKFLTITLSRRTRARFFIRALFCYRGE
jgi:hypothetical protein